ncbi:MAG TPA: MAPEG family protein [Pseudomonadales bacterium]|nr:MAPEG family protein [Pseudomonadales bacterium]
MTVELTMLVYSVVLLFALILIQALAGVLAQGLPQMAGARDNLPEPKAFQARTKRVVDNHREGLALFAPLVLVAAVAHISNPATVLGAQLFFYARVVHAGLYLAGVPWVRPLAWAAGIVGTAMVFTAVVQA